MNPLISIIIPVYNVEEYLDRCIESVVNQTYSNLEIILIDDGSGDSGPEKCDRWAHTDKRICVYHKDNGGVSRARNYGMSVARGDYWMFLDSDDYLSHDCVQILYDRIKSTDCKAAMGKHVDVYEDGSTDAGFCAWMTNSVLPKADVIKRFSYSSYFPVTAWAKLFDKSVWDDIVYPDQACGEDMWIFPEIMEKCGEFAVTDAVVYYYYQRSSSAVHTKTEQSKSEALKSTLKLGRYLYEQGGRFALSSWFGRVINEAFTLADYKSGVRLILDYFTQEEIKEILRCISKKSVVKWMMMNTPVSMKAYRRVKSGF